jgi:predicted transcriptional regulator of viral defense system
MPKHSIQTFIKQLHRPVFTTYELAAISGKSPSTTTQALNFLQRQGLISKIYRGIWIEVNSERLSPYTVIPFLFPRQRAYVSFISALHLYGIVEQIPQVITLASTVHTKTIHTRIGTFSVHRIAPSFFDGFIWYKKTGSFLIAEPEKALVDSLYLSARRKKQFSYFPELYFPKSFSFRKAKEWVKKIPNSKISSCAQKRLDTILQKRGQATF